MRTRVALIGGRGYAGTTFLELLVTHPALQLALASSSSHANQPIQAQVPGWPDPAQCFSALSLDEVGEVDASVWVLALANDAGRPWVQAIQTAHPGALILDLSADWRHSEDWVYGLSEWKPSALAGARRIANPGCYATGALFGLLPLRDQLAAPPVVFGVSGYSGAGRTPSPRNDPARLKDNLIPYALTGHGHEQEISSHLGRPVRFHPHVAPFFRGISLTIAVQLTEPASGPALTERFRQVYADQPLVEVAEAIPEIRQVAGKPNLVIGGFSIDPRDPLRASLVVVLDNLLKGAASQALQNLNLALGWPGLTGLNPPQTED